MIDELISKGKVNDFPPPPPEGGSLCREESYSSERDVSVD